MSTNNRQTGVGQKSPPAKRDSVQRPSKSASSKPKHIRRHKPFDESISPNAQRVFDIRPSDIIFGRGKGYQDHPGNRRMREIIRQYKDQYNKIDRSRKRDLVEAVYTLITANGARFLHKSANEDIFVIVDIPIALLKVRNTLRCKKGLLRKETSEEDDDGLLSSGVSTSDKEQAGMQVVLDQSQTAATATAMVGAEATLLQPLARLGNTALGVPPSHGGFAASLSLSHSIEFQRQLMERQALRLNEITRNDVLSRIAPAVTVNLQSLYGPSSSTGQQIRDRGLLGGTSLGVLPVQGTPIALLSQISNHAVPSSLLQSQQTTAGQINQHSRK